MSENEDMTESEVVVGPAAPGRNLTWAQRAARAALALAAQDSSMPHLDACEHRVLHVTGVGVFPARSAQYPQISEVGVIVAQEGTFRTYTDAGLAAVKLLLGELGPQPWPEPYAVAVVHRETKHGSRATLGIVAPDAHPAARK